MSFQAKVDYTKSDFVAFSKVHLRTKMKKQRIVQLVCAAVCCLMEILLIVTTILYRVKDTTFIVLMVLMPILAAEMLLLPRTDNVSCRLAKPSKLYLLFVDMLRSIKTSKF